MLLAGMGVLAGRERPVFAWLRRIAVANSPSVQQPDRSRDTPVTSNSQPRRPVPGRFDGLRVIQCGFGPRSVSHMSESATNRPNCPREPAHLRIIGGSPIALRAPGISKH